LTKEEWHIYLFTDFITMLSIKRGSYLCALSTNQSKTYGRWRHGSTQT
jgi:hypothetical protein